MVNLSRHLKVKPELALQKANKKFEKRFRQVEENVLEQGKIISQCSLTELDKAWNSVKEKESKNQ